MLNRLRTEKTPSPIDVQIDAIHLEMTTYGVSSPEYPELFQKLERLYALKALERPQRVSRDTVWQVVGSVVTVLVVVIYEGKHVWTTKAPVFKSKP